WCRNFKCAAPIAVFGLLLLGGCASETLPEQPTMYANMAESGARIHAQAAATMISLYRKNNGVGALVVDPELISIPTTQPDGTAPEARSRREVPTAPSPAIGRLRFVPWR